MYYEDKIIDGVLYWRNHPRGKWYEADKRAVTAKLAEANAEIIRLQGIIESGVSDV